MRKSLPALLLLLVFPAVARATTLLPMYLDDLTSASQTVAYGRVVGARTEWDAGHNWIFTVYTIQPTQYLKGNLGTSFELREPGGERDGLVLLIAGVPVFQPGQEALLFVWTGPDGTHQLTGFEQGAVAVSEDARGIKVAARGIRLGSAADQRGTYPTVAPERISSRLLPELFEQIRISVDKTRRPAAGQ